MWKVLVVDDEAINRRLIRGVLAYKAVCDCVETGQEALIAFTSAYETKNPYQVVLLDIAMPQMDGIEVVKAMRGYEETNGIRLGKGIPIIMVTAFKEPFMEAFQEGADDYILKPVDQDTLIQKIRDRVPPVTD